MDNVTILQMWADLHERDCLPVVKMVCPSKKDKNVVTNWCIDYVSKI